MSGHVDEDLWSYALGTLEEPRRAEVAGHVADCESCAAGLRSAEETLAMVALELPPIQPPPEMLDRLLASTQSRFAGVVDRLARLWDLGLDKTRELLDGLATAVWEPSGLPGVDLIHVTAGPATAGADPGFVRFAPNTRFPMHRHVGDEVMLILEGDVVENDGLEGHVGDAMCKPAGSEHSFVVGAEGCLVAILLHGGIEVEGLNYSPSKTPKS
jgi:anti-sigma factor ChrR (cupin superfamily)